MNTKDPKDYIIHQSIGNIYIKDLEGRYLSCNDAYLNFLKLKSYDEIIGKTDRDFYPQVLAEELIKADQAIMKGGVATTIEESGLDTEGNFLVCISHKAPLRDSNNNVIGITGNSIMLNNYSKTEDYHLIQGAGNLYCKDRNGHYINCNQSYAELCGFSSPDEIKGKTEENLSLKTPGENRADKVNVLDQVIMKQGVEQVYEEWIIDCTGTLNAFITKKTPLWDKDSNVIGLVATSINITKQKQAEIAKSEFLRNMSHDIMTPFTGILGISKMLYEDEVDPDKKLNLTYLIQSGERLLELLKQVLEIAELGNNKHTELSEFDIYSLINETVEIMQPAIQLKGLTLSFNSPKQIVKSDRLKLGRMLVNLVSNALKFTHQGFIHIEVSCNQYLTIEVKDTGIGIPADKFEAIFEQFEKLSESSKNSQFMGAGIGLYLVKQIAQELQGSIHVESKVGVGSKFTFIQPLHLKLSRS